MKIPGFRTRTPWKMVLATLAYGTILFFVVLAISNPSPSPTKDVTQTIAESPKPIDTPSSTPPTSQPAGTTEKKWTKIGSWSGTGIKSTETFTTASREWRITWKSYDEAFKGAGIIQIFVKDDKGNLVSLAANVQGEGSDTSYVRTKPGKYFLDINSANVKWEVVAEEQR